MPPSGTIKPMAHGRSCLALIAASLLTISQPADGCKCGSPSSACQAFESSELVFVGKVVDFQPSFANPWEASKVLQSVQQLTEDELQRLETNPSPGLLAKARKMYAAFFPEPWKSKVERAQSSAALLEIVDGFFDQGIRMRLNVLDVFKGPVGKTVELRSEYSSCSLPLLLGETYVVYAQQNEDGALATSQCSRTNRLSDAGADLAYLFFQIRGGDDTKRLEGFVTSSQEDIENRRFHDGVSQPVTDAVVHIQGGTTGSRYTHTGKDGRFVIDGLAPGEYRLSVLNGGKNGSIEPLTSPKSVQVKATGCSIEPVLIKPER